MPEFESERHWDSELLPLLGLGATVFAAAIGAALAASLVGAALERAGHAPRLASILLRLSPRLTRQVAAAAAALVIPLGGAGTAEALENPVRAWLAGASTTAPTTTMPSTAWPSTSLPSSTGTSTTVASATAAASAVAPLSPPLAAVPATGREYVVRPGDSLWSITAGFLGRGATNHAIDRGWRAVYAANRAHVGPEPALIHPGLVLVLPPIDPQP